MEEGKGALAECLSIKQSERNIESVLNISCALLTNLKVCCQEVEY